MQFYPLTVREIRAETDSVTSVALVSDSEEAGQFAFDPGQFLILRSNIDGADIRRAYSLCSQPGDPILQVAIKHVERGIFSSWVRTDLKVGDVLEALPPEGRFLGEGANLEQGDYLGIAAGSGIAPIMSLMRTILSSSRDSRFTLIYGNRTSSSIIFRHELNDLKNIYMDRLRLINVLSQEDGDVELTCGRLDKNRLTRLLSVFCPQPVERAFICGPDELMFAARDVLLAKGMDSENVRIESFGDFAPHEKIKRNPDHGNCDVRMKLNGRTSKFSMPQEEDTLLEAGLLNGVDLPFACKGGVCATCRGRIVKGSVEMDKNFALTEAELSEGFVLTCRSRPITDEIEIDFDI